MNASKKCVSCTQAFPHLPDSGRRVDLGRYWIIAVDLLPGRFEVALTLGATKTVCNRARSQEDLAAELLELTGGGGDVVVETAGVPEVVPTVFDATRPGGLTWKVG